MAEFYAPLYPSDVLPMKIAAIDIDLIAGGVEGHESIEGEDFQKWLNSDMTEPFKTLVHFDYEEFGDINITMELLEETGHMDMHVYNKSIPNREAYLKDTYVKCKYIKLSSDELYEGDSISLRFYPVVPKDGVTFKWKSEEEINAFNDALSKLTSQGVGFEDGDYIDGLFSFNTTPEADYSNYVSSFQVSINSEDIIYMPPNLCNNKIYYHFLDSELNAMGHMVMVLFTVNEGFFAMLAPIYLSPKAIPPVDITINDKTATIQSTGYVYAPQGIGIGAETYIHVDPNKDERLSLKNLRSTNFPRRLPFKDREYSAEQYLIYLLSDLAIYVWVEHEFDIPTPEPTLKAIPLQRGTSLQGNGAKATELLKGV